MSRGTRARVRGPARSTRCPRHSGLCPRARGFDQVSPEIALESDGPWGRPYVPGDIGPGPKARAVHQQARATQALF